MSATSIAISRKANNRRYPFLTDIKWVLLILQLNVSYELEALPDLSNQLLLALVSNCNILNQSREMSRAVSSQYESVASFAQEIDEITVMTW